MISPDPDITRLLDRMEKRGLTSRSGDSKEGRAIFTRTTEDGRAILEKLDKPVQEFHRKRLAHLDRNRIRSLIQWLEAARSRIRFFMSYNRYHDNSLNIGGPRECQATH
jgi:DNA-binding MarR family transcriptional regulator